MPDLLELTRLLTLPRAGHVSDFRIRNSPEQSGSWPWFAVSVDSKSWLLYQGFRIRLPNIRPIRLQFPLTS